MFVSKNVVFKSRNVLTKEMLTETYNFPRKVYRMELKKYGDGILSGCDFVMRGDCVFINPGIVKFKDEIYFLDEDMNISNILKFDHLESAKYYIYLSEGRVIDAQGVIASSLELKVGGKEVKKFNNIILLGDFRKDSGLKVMLPDLKSNINSKDVSHPYLDATVISPITREYSCFGGNTFPPEVFSFIRDYLVDKQEKGCMDFALLMDLQNNEVLSIDSIKTYIISRHGRIANDRKDIFKNLLEVLHKPEIQYSNDNLVTVEKKEKKTIYQDEDYGDGMI